MSLVILCTLLAHHCTSCMSINAKTSVKNVIYRMVYFYPCTKIIDNILYQKQKMKRCLSSNDTLVSKVKIILYLVFT